MTKLLDQIDNNYASANRDKSAMRAKMALNDSLVQEITALMQPNKH